MSTLSIDFFTYEMRKTCLVAVSWRRWARSSSDWSADYLSVRWNWWRGEHRLKTSTVATLVLAPTPNALSALFLIAFPQMSRPKLG